VTSANSGIGEGIARALAAAEAARSKRVEPSFCSSGLNENRRLTLRHAAALAPVGWYLMLPPVASGGRVNAEAPLGQWERWGTYDVVGECQGAITKLRDMRTRLRLNGV
jgi:hypothetical protein